MSLRYFALLAFLTIGISSVYGSLPIQIIPIDNYNPYTSVNLNIGADQPIHLYVDTIHADSWIVSDNCWTPRCFPARTYNSGYRGKFSPTHISNGTIGDINSYFGLNVMGLQMTETIRFMSTDEIVYFFPNISFIDGYEVKTAPYPTTDDVGETGLLALGLIYGQQTDLTPFIYQLVDNGNVTHPVFTLSYAQPLYRHILITGAPANGDWTFIMGNNTVPTIPIAARDGTWNFMAMDLSLNMTALGYNGLIVIDTINTNLTFPRAIASTLGALLNATSYTIDDIDYYTMPCIDSTNFPSINITTQNGNLPILPIYYFQNTTAPCYLAMTGQDLFSSGGNPIWDLGIPLLKGYGTTFNGTLGLETINFNQSLPSMP